MPVKFTRAQAIASFWSKVQVGAPLECWLWKAGTFKGGLGYGAFQFEGRPTQAHRLAFFFSNGYLPEGKCVCHTCDNPLCCNPVHLFAATRSENCSDRDRKGRQAKGVYHGRAKFTTEGVVALRGDRQNGMTYEALGKKYSVHHSTARRVALGFRYK